MGYLPLIAFSKAYDRARGWINRCPIASRVQNPFHLAQPSQTEYDWPIQGSNATTYAFYQPSSSCSPALSINAGSLLSKLSAKLLRLTGIWRVTVARHYLC